MFLKIPAFFSHLPRENSMATDITHPIETNEKGGMAIQSF
jgi:hypothetical protein